MNNTPQSVSDDENDILLFYQLQKHVLNHYPNPDRIGCFDEATLRTFVETPGKLDLSDHKYLHIFECAECTRELIELRRIREEQLERTRVLSPVASHGGWLQHLKSKPVAAVALVCAAAIIIAVTWRIMPARATHDTQSDVAVLETIDLSSRGVSRGLEQPSPANSLSLPRKLVKLHLVLPYYSPAGSYRVTIGKVKNVERVAANGSAIAVVQGARTELSVQMDLRNISPGSYYLGTFREGDGEAYFYSLALD